MIEDLVLRSRSRRRFQESRRVSLQVLRDLVQVARLAPSAANLQPLKYILSVDHEVNARIFDCLAWAGYLTEWSGPPPGERPSAYVVMLGDLRITENFGCDHGIAAQTLMLAAAERGLGGCIIGSIEREPLRRSLAIASRYEILLVLALGYAVEEVVIEDMADGDVRYWRDPSGVHHVPKRQLKEIILAEFGS